LLRYHKMPLCGAAWRLPVRVTCNKPYCMSSLPSRDIMRCAHS
jgi:hypothetical protein